MGDVVDTIADVADTASTFLGPPGLGGGGGFGLLGGQQSILGGLSPSGDPSLGGSPRALAGINSDAAKGSSREPIPPKRWIYGRATTSGAVFFLEKAPPHLVIGYLVADGQSDGLEQIFVQGTEVFIGSDGFAITAPYDQIGQSTQLLQVSFRDGSPDQQIDPIIAATFPNVPLNFRQQGITTVVIKADFGQNDDDHREFWGESFDPLIRLRGRRVYDPRDFSQLRDDPLTWKWSDNSILCVADFLRADFGGQLPAALIDYDTVAAEADIADELVLTLDGTEKRYTANGLLTGENTPIEILQSILTSARSTAVWSLGRYKVLAGSRRDPVTTIVESDLAGAVQYSDAQKGQDLLNEVRTEFVALQDRDYQVQTGPVLSREDLQAQDDGVFSTTLRFPFTEGASRVQRLGKAALEDTRLGKSLKLTLALGVTAMWIEVGDVVRVQIDSLPWINGIYQIDRSNPSTDFTTTEFDLTEFSNAIYDFDPAVDEQEFFVQDIDVETTA